MDRRPTFFTSDWHLDHANVIIYSKRPFRDVNHMNRVLINNYNATVPENGICWFLGDMGLGSGETIKKALAEMNGTKILVLGNHDKGAEAMYRMGFDAVMYSASLVIAGKQVTLSHCPLLGTFREDVTGMKNAQPGANWHGDHKNQMYSMHDHGQFHLHGHIHSPNSGKSEKILGKQRDVGVDANGYRPVSISEIESWITKHGR